jgi:CRP-like cAMP-binding protein
MIRAGKALQVAGRKRVERGAFVVRAGDSTDSLYVLLAGRAKVTNTDEEGGRSFWPGWGRVSSLVKWA